MVAVERLKPFIGCIAGRNFFPGVNILTDEDYATIKENRTFKEELACRNLEIMREIKSKKVPAGVPGQPGQTNEEQVAAEIQKLSVAQATPLIDKILERKTLEKILGTDGRKGIQDACEVQLRILLARDDDDQSKHDDDDDDK